MDDYRQISVSRIDDAMTVYTRKTRSGRLCSVPGMGFPFAVRAN